MSHNLSPKQKEELLDKGGSYVLVNFKLEGAFPNKRTGKNHLSFKVTKLRKTEYVRPVDVPPED